MDYELCKKLKEAGFPQEIQNYSPTLYYVEKENSVESGEAFYPHVKLPPNYCKVPTLSELIEACGEVFTSLEWLGGVGSTAEWEATAFENHEQVAIGEGRTPEETVANLYLDLNEA